MDDLGLSSEERKLLARSQGGKVTALRNRQEALKEYYSSPNICRFCEKILPVPDGVKVAEIRKKQFCDHSCAAKSSNLKRVLRKSCRCGAKISYRHRKCKECLPLGSLKVLSRLISGMNKNQIYEHARRSIPDGPCSNCGYGEFTEVCHIKSISSFSESATVGEVNQRNNLVRLCPNCHWEFDHGMLKGRFQ